jgi:hypothetical protein
VRTTIWLLAALLLVAPCRAAEKDMVVLKLVAKKDAYAWDRASSPKEFRKVLDDAAAKLMAGQDPGELPKPSAVDFVLEVRNDGKEEATVYVGGTPNLYTFEVKGPGVIDLKPLLAFPAIFRLPQAVTLAPGMTYEIPVKQLSDGRMGMARWLYWTEPGEYTVAATYQLSDAKGGRGPLLKSEPVKIKVEEKK